MNLEAYLRRIGILETPPPVLETLRRLHVAHLAAFPFHNLEIQRRGSIRLDLDSIERKFLGPAGGGYCFEQNTLFGAVLTQIGFRVTPLLGRVGPPDKRALNHLLLRVDIDGEPWLADVGFGAEGPLEPLPLREGARVTEQGIEYTLNRDAYHWVLTMRCGETTEELYEFADAPHTTGDIEMANYYTATHPASIFRHTMTIQRSTAEERVILRPKVITRYKDGVRVDTPIETSDLRQYARDLFDIDLGEEPLLFEDDLSGKR